MPSHPSSEGLFEGGGGLFKEEKIQGFTVLNSRYHEGVDNFQITLSNLLSTQNIMTAK